MAAKAGLPLLLRIVALTVLLFVCYAVAGGIVGLEDRSRSPEQAAAAAATLLVVCLLHTVVLTHVILRSRWAGWRLMAVVFVVYYGAATFMSQIESAVFITHLPAGVLPRLFVMGALVAAPFAVLAVLILGKRTADGAGVEANMRLVMPAGAWAAKLAVIAAAYLVLYFTFGYFIAWRNPAVPQYYGGVDEGSFFVHMGVVLKETSWMIPFQVMRALLWTAIALPVVRMMKGRWTETAAAIGLLFAVLMTALLLLPNPYMPDAVRRAHLLETAPSNFIFGWLVGWLLTPRGASVNEAIRDQ